jgi:phage shock protein C
MMTRVAVGDRIGLYRSRRGIICGVCRGLAEYFDFSVFWTRMIVLGLFIFTGFWPIAGLYLLAIFLMKRAPMGLAEVEEEAETPFATAYAQSRSTAIHHLRRVFDKLDQRIQRLEDGVTTREYDWDRRMRQNSTD